MDEMNGRWILIAASVACCTLGGQMQVESRELIAKSLTVLVYRGILGSKYGFIVTLIVQQTLCAEEPVPLPNVLYSKFCILSQYGLVSERL